MEKTSKIVLAIIATLYGGFNMFNSLMATTVMQQQVYPLRTAAFILFVVMWILATDKDWGGKK